MSNTLKQRFNLSPVLFFPATILYEELLLRLSSVDASFFDFPLIYILIYAVAFGGLFFAITNAVKHRGVRLFLTGLLTFLLVVVFCAEYCVKSFFDTFFDIGYMLQMAGDVTNDFANETKDTVLDAIPYILAALYPLWLLLTRHEKIVPRHRSGIGAVAGVVLFAVLEIATVAVLLLGTGSIEEDREYFTTDYAVNSAIPRFGLMCDMQLEAVYGIFGTPEPKLDAPDGPVSVPTTPPSTGEDPLAPNYGYNTMDIDFEALSAQTTDTTLKDMHRYFSSLTPTQQNEYTGLFKDKNLIFIVAESFCPYVIDPERTPTLYRLSTEGFIFNNFYQPDWHQSTTGGEFSATCGLVPTSVNGTLSFYASSTKTMAFALGNQFSRLGYACRAYHNNSFDFYSRHHTHPNLGYDYKGIGNGLKLISRGSWPNSDHELILVTADEYIENYVNNGEKFHTYYMTVSGHAGYGWDTNRMAAKHREETEGLTQYPMQVRGYLAAQMELELALNELVNKLEAAGIADDTVIAMTSDHYPYKLSDKEYNALETTPTDGRSMERFRNSFILWCGSMEQPVVIDDPCSSIDILPTLSNLFGLEYDSRLLSGRDILSTNYSVDDPNSPQPFVIGTDSGIGSSWVSLAGSYDAPTKTFTPAPGYESYADNTEYIKAMSRKAKNMFNYSKLILAKNYYKVAVTPIQE